MSTDILAAKTYSYKQNVQKQTFMYGIACTQNKYYTYIQNYINIIWQVRVHTYIWAEDQCGRWSLNQIIK